MSSTQKIPLYRRIKAAIDHAYVEGQPADQPLPSERDLAVEFGATRATVRKAIGELVAQGRLYSIRGGGTFCVGPGIAKTLEFTSFSQDIRDRGQVPSSRLLGVEATRAGEHVARRLGLSPGAEVVELRRLRCSDGEPMCLETASLPRTAVPGLADRDLTGSLYELLEDGYGLDLNWAEQDVAAAVLDPDQARLLGVAPFSAALRIERTTFDRHGRRVEFCATAYRADKFSLRFSVRRRG